MEVIGSSQRQKATTLTKMKLRKRWIIFCQEILLPQKLETDVIFALEKTLQKVET